MNKKKLRNKRKPLQQQRIQYRKDKRIEEIRMSSTSLFGEALMDTKEPK